MHKHSYIARDMLCVFVNFLNFGCTYYIRFVGYVSVTMWVLQLHREIEL